MMNERARLGGEGYDFYGFPTAEARAEFMAEHTDADFVELDETTTVGHLTFTVFFLGEKMLRGKAAAQAALEAFNEHD